MTYTMVDGVVLVVLIISTILAWSRGLVRELLAIIGWIVALFVAARFAHLMVPMIEGLPFIREYLAGSCELLTAVGFVALFIIMMIVMALLTPLFSNMVQSSALSTLDGGLGGLFGFLRGAIIVLLLVIIYDNFIAKSTPLDAVEQSRSYAIFSSPKESIEDQLPDQNIAPTWLSSQFDKITAHCANPT